MLRLPAHLQRLPSGQFHFRIVVPPELRPYFGRREIKRSLKTCDRKQALQRARILACCANEAFDRARSGDLMGRDNDHQTRLQKIGWRDATGSEYTIDADLTKPEEKEFAERLLEGKVATTSATAPSETLTALITSYCDEKKREGAWTEKSEAENRAIYDLFVRIVGDVPVAEITAERARAYKVVLQKLPPNLNKNPLYRAKSIEEVVDSHPATVMSVTTVNKNLNRIASLFEWAKRNRYVSDNFFSGLTLKVKRTATEERDPSSPADLSVLFSAAQFHGSKPKHPYYYWLPLLALYTGARLNELCQLHLDDIREVDGIWCVDINEDAPDKKLKTAASKRIVPLHPKLIDLGLLNYASLLRSRGAVRFFPELKQQRDGYGQAASKWFARFRTNLGIASSKGRKDFHSFRHCFSDELKRHGTSEAMTAALMGHTHEQITYGRYGSGFDVSALDAAIQQIDLDVDVNPHSI